MRALAAMAALAVAAWGGDFEEPLQSGIDDAARRLDAASPDVYYRLGLRLGQTADFRGAEAAFRKAVELRPVYPEAHYNLGLTLIANPQSKLDWPGAISEFRIALQQRPAYAAAANQIGAGLLATGDTDGAIQALKHALDLNPRLAEAHLNLAIAFEKNDSPDAAEKEYRAAIGARAAYAEAYTGLGKLLLRQGLTGDARKELLQAFRINPDLTDAHYAFARLLQAQGNRAEASAEFDVAKDLAQRKASAMRSARLTNDGLEAAAKGDADAALKMEREAVAAKPDYGVPHHNLGLVLADRGDFVGAASELIKSASLMPGQAAPWFDLGRVLARKGDRAGALAALKFARRLSPSDPRIAREIQALHGSDEPGASKPPFGAIADTVAEHLAFADELKAAKDYQGMTGELLRVLALEPANIEARKLLIFAYEHDGRPADAAIESRKLATLL